MRIGAFVRSGMPLAVILVLTALSALTAVPAQAQVDRGDSSENPWAGVEEMIVTSSGEMILTKIDTSAAIGFDAETLQAEGINTVADLAAFTPNLEIKTAFAAVNPTIFLRGVGLDDFNSNSASAVSIYQDDFYMNSPAGQLFGLFDVQEVAVHLGPQPTLTNASAGAIHIRSRKPTDEFESYLTSTFGNYDLRQFEGMLNIPVVPGRLKIRGSFKIQERGGITKNRCPSIISATTDNTERGQCRFTTDGPSRNLPEGPTSTGKDWVNDKDNWAGRAHLSYLMPLPGDQEIDWLFSVSGGQNKSLATQYQHTGLRERNLNTPGSGVAVRRFFTRTGNGNIATDGFNYTEQFSESDAFAGEYDRIGPERLDLLGISLTGHWEPSDSIEIESLSGYFWHDRETYANDDGGPKNWQNNDYTDDAWQFSQETTLTWNWSEDSRASIGAYYLIEELDAENIFRNNSDIFSGNAFAQVFEQDTSLAAVYGKLRYELPPLPGRAEFVENFRIDASVRYSWAQKQMNNATAFLIIGGGSKDTSVGKEKAEWTAWTGDAQLTYLFTEEISAYFKYSRGWKPGHFNANTLRSTQPVSDVDPETLDSLEVALHADWLDGRLKTKLTAFKYDYQNLQVFQVTTDAVGFILRRLINASEAEIWGVEWDIIAEPVEDLVFRITGGYLDSAYTDFKSVFERTVIRPGEGSSIEFFNVDYSDNRLLSSPEWSHTGSVEYTVSTRFGDVVPRLSFTYRDKVFFDANEGCGAEGNLNQCLIKQQAMWIFNATLRYTSPNGRIEVLGFVRNFLDKEYKVQSFDLTRGSGFILDVYGDPRTFGAAVTFRFD